jgi:glycosyltransferase involved in cell wall biosynthesis
LLQNRNPALKVAIIIPAYNEEKFIEKSILCLEKYLKLNLNKFNIKILISEDGSIDNTFNIITRLAEEYDNISIRHNPNKLGRGRAVKEAWRDIDADIYAYLDADFATDISHLQILLDKCCQGFDIVTGSRYVKYSVVNRPILRTIASKVYNQIINIIFKTAVKDHQCGFKAVTNVARGIILKESIFNDWFWDTEIFIIAHHKGLRVCEVPVQWDEKRSTKTPLIRLLKDVWIHGRGIIRILRNKGSLD